MRVTAIFAALAFLCLLIGTLAEAPTLVWAPAPAGDCTSMDPTSTIMSVPIVYEPSTAGEMGIYVKRYMTKGATSADIHIIMLPGGPGQEQTILESHLTEIGKFLKGFKLAFYLPDLRCVGQSGSFVRPNDIDWIAQCDALAAKSPVPLEAINLTNAAYDILRLAEAIRTSPEFTSNAQLNIFGVSFGATWAYRVLQLDRTGLFTASLLDSVAPLDGIVSPDSDEGLLRNCNDHPYCKAQFGGDAANAKNMLTEILNPSMNKCAEQLAQTFDDTSIFHPSYSPLMKFYILSQAALEGFFSPHKRMHTAQLALAFIKATHICADPNEHKKMINAMLEEGYPGKARGASVPRKQTNVSTHHFFGPMQSNLITRASSANVNNMNMLVNYLFFMGEAYDLPNGGNGRCGPVTLSHQCALFGHYRTLYQLMKKYVKPRPTNAMSPFSTSTRVYFVHGEVDMMTPVLPAMRFADNVQGKVRKLVYRNAGHSMISEGDCAACIWKEVMIEGSTSATDACMRASNSVPLDWTFKQAPAFQKWWDQSIPVQYIPDPIIPGAPGSGLSLTITISITVIVIVLAGAGVGVYLKMRPKEPNK